MKNFIVETSARHVHVTQQDLETLFGKGYELKVKKMLSQPGQYACEERVDVVGPKKTLTGVSILGPVRNATQVEISLTDGRTLGIQPPIRLSGDIQGSPGAVLIGSRGRVELETGVIAAQRHIHLTPEAAKGFGVSQGQLVKLKTLTERPVTFEQVAVRISPDFAPYAHLDYDEANACGFQKGDLGMILR